MSEPGLVQTATTVRAAQRPSLTPGRLTVVIILGAALLLTLALPLREFLSQRAHIARLEARSAEQSARVEALQREADKWASDEYAIQQARERLHFQFPGETGFVVVDPPAKTGDNTLPGDAYEDDRAWYERALSAVEKAQQSPDSSVVEVRPDAPH